MTTHEDELTAEQQREALMQAERKGRKTVERLSQKLGRLEIEYANVDDLRPNPWNPNRQSEHDFELLCRSMEEDGFTQPIVCARVSQDHIDKDERIRNAAFTDGQLMIVDGEHRWRAGRKLGLSEVPIVITPMSVEQMRIATLRHNRARGSEDIGLSADVLRDLELLGAKEWGLDSLGMDELEWERLVEDIPAPEALADEQPSQSWVPDAAVGGDGQALSTEAEVRQGGSGEWTNAATQAAVDAVRERERAMAAAHTQEQRDMIRQETSKAMFRLSLIFHGEEADVIKAALGSAPAETIANMCREAQGAIKEELDAGWVTIDSVLGTRVIPPDAAGVLKECLKKMEASGVIGPRNRFQVIEYLAAEFLAGA